MSVCVRVCVCIYIYMYEDSSSTHAHDACRSIKTPKMKVARELVWATQRRGGMHIALQTWKMQGICVYVHVCMCTLTQCSSHLDIYTYTHMCVCARL